MVPPKQIPVFPPLFYTCSFQTASNDTNAEEKPAKEKVPKSLKVPLELDMSFMDMPNVTEDEFQESLKK